jgi:hypothetical protein
MFLETPGPLDPEIGVFDVTPDCDFDDDEPEDG